MELLLFFQRLFIASTIDTQGNGKIQTGRVEITGKMLWDNTKRGITSWDKEKIFNWKQLVPGNSDTCFSLDTMDTNSFFLLHLTGTTLLATSLVLLIEFNFRGTRGQPKWHKFVTKSTRTVWPHGKQCWTRKILGNKIYIPTKHPPGTEQSSVKEHLTCNQRYNDACYSRHHHWQNGHQFTPPFSAPWGATRISDIQHVAQMNGTCKTIVT